MSEDAPNGPRPEASTETDGLRVLASTLLFFGILSAVPYASDSLARFRLFKPLSEKASIFEVSAVPAPTASFGEASLAQETRPLLELAQPEPPTLPEDEGVRPAALATRRSPVPIDDPRGHALDAFFHSLLAVEDKKPGSIARITYFGDSIVASDLITGTLRRKFHKAFGDAGHGFALMANAWPAYFHNDITRFATAGWQVSRVVGPFAKDGLYGLGGVSFRSESANVFSRFATNKSGSFGRLVSRFIFDYLEQPDGGTVLISIDGKEQERLSTNGPKPQSKFKTYEVPDGPHEFEARTLGANVRAFGLAMERNEPGVVLDAIGIQGCRIRFLDQNDDDHFAEQLKLRAPNLVVFQYGMNESEDGELYPLSDYETTMKAVLHQVRTALPDSSCLLVGPLDRVDKTADGFRSRPVIPKLSAIQKRSAAEVGCAYFDTLTAMGGPGSMGTWHKRGLGGADFIHPSGAGAELLAEWIFSAILDNYDRWKATLRR